MVSWPSAVGRDLCFAAAEHDSGQDWEASAVLAAETEMAEYLHKAHLKQPLELNYSQKPYEPFRFVL